MSFGFSAGEILQMAEMKVSHEQTFAAIRQELSSDEKGTTAFDPQDETQAYLAAMADPEIFDDSKNPAALVAQTSSPVEALHIAIGLEKESILFYLGLKDLVWARLGRDRVEQIIEEERGTSPC